MRVGQRVVGEPFRSADCHSQCAHWLRNDGLFARGTAGQRDTWVPPYRALFCRGGRPALSARLGAFLVVRRGGALPLPRATARVAPTDGHTERGKAGRRGRRPLRRGTRSAVWRVEQNSAPKHGRWVRGVPALMAWTGCRWAAMMRHRRR